MEIKRGQEITVRIEDLAFGGKGIARLETDKGKFVLFVPNTMPGQLVRARVIKKSKRHANCKLLEVKERSEIEINIPYQLIPGAPYATMPVEMQHEHKRTETIELFRRIGGINQAEDLLDEFIPSPRTWNYRNKMEYSFSNLIYNTETDEEEFGFALGFKHRGQWWSVEQMEGDSGLFDAQLEDYLPILRVHCEKTGLPAWNPKAGEGFFRYFTVRKSFDQDQLLINLTTTSSHLDTFNVNEFITHVRESLGNRVAGILHTINDSTGDRSHDVSSTTQTIYGADIITEKLLGLKFEISMQSFFQPNPASAELLYQKAIDYTIESLNPDKPIILDLFCGTGTIGQLLRKNIASDYQILGVDIVAAAVEDATANAKLNNLANLSFIAADVGKFLLEHTSYQNKIGSVVLDPPRSGISPKSLRKVIRLNASTIVYVSCNPATQARDCIDLIESGYELEKLSLVDQFPHTSHIETVAVFRRNNHHENEDESKG